MELIPEITIDPQLKFYLPQPDLILGSLFVVTDLTFGYTPDKILFKSTLFSNTSSHDLSSADVNVNIQPDSRIALVGSNGVGKSTFLKLLLQQLEPVSGHIQAHPKLRVGRFTQHHVDQLDMNKTPLGWFQDMYKDAKHQTIRKHLGQMGISGNLALQPIYSLSGTFVTPSCAD